MNRSVVCPCGVSTPVTEKQCGTNIFCTCRRPVVVPLLEEFEQNEKLLTASTVENRIELLLRSGVIPPKNGCVKCRVPCEPFPFSVICEWYVTRSTHNGLLSAIVFILMLPIGYLFLRPAPEQHETTGRDTIVKTPLPVCDTCRRQLFNTSRWKEIATFLAAIVVAGFATYFFISLIELIFVVIGLGSIVLLRFIKARRQQNQLKQLLQTVPAYHHLLIQYPKAMIKIPKL